MAKSLVVRILADPSDLSRGLKTATAETEGFGHKFGAVLKAGGLVAAAGIGVAAIAIDKSVKAAMAAQVSQAALSQALKNTHQSVAEMTPALEKAEAAGRALGFSDNESRVALSRLETATKSTTKSIADLSIAQDIARFKHMDLTAASQMMAQAMTGSQRAAKQLGIVVSPVTDAVQKLKDAGIDNSTAMGRQELKAAALTDKLATGQKVIEAVTEKVHGQAQAYAETAAGGMATFGAQVDFMEEKLGNKLLPTLVNVMTWVNAHWPQIQAVFTTVFQAVGRAVEFVKPYIEDFIALSVKVYDRVHADWPKISATITRVMNEIRSIISGVVTVAEAIWSRFGSTITTVAQRSFNAVVSVTRNVLNIVEGVISLFADVLHGRWGAAWNDLKKIVSNAMQAVLTIITTAIHNLYDEGLAVGKAIVSGVKDGITSMATSAYNTAKGFVSKMKNALEVWKSPPDAYGRWLGGEVVRGVIEGFHAMQPLAVKAGREVVTALTNVGADSILGYVDGMNNLRPKARDAIGFISADARRGTDEIITTVEGAWVKVSARMTQMTAAVAAAAALAAGIGQVPQWMIDQGVAASSAANPGAAGGTPYNAFTGAGSLFSYSGSETPAAPPVHVYIDGKEVFTAVQKQSTRDIRAGGFGVQGA